MGVSCAMLRCKDENQTVLYCGYQNTSDVLYIKAASWDDIVKWYMSHQGATELSITSFLEEIDSNYRAEDIKDYSSAIVKEDSVIVSAEVIVDYGHGIVFDTEVDLTHKTVVGNKIPQWEYSEEYEEKICDEYFPPFWRKLKDLAFSRFDPMTLDGCSFGDIIPLPVSEEKWLARPCPNPTYLVTTTPFVLQVEDYDKWYSLYYAYKDRPDSTKLMLVEVSHGNILCGVDHTYEPKSVVEFCFHNCIYLDAISYIAIAKRYSEDTLDGDESEEYPVPSRFLPDKWKLFSVLKFNPGKCNYFGLDESSYLEILRYIAVGTNETLKSRHGLFSHALKVIKSETGTSQISEYMIESNERLPYRISTGGRFISIKQDDDIPKPLREIFKTAEDFQKESKDGETFDSTLKTPADIQFIKYEVYHLKFD